MMNGPDKSDPAIVAAKPANNAERSAAEPVERRVGAKGNASQQSTHRTLSRISVSQALERTRQRFAVTHPRWEPYAGKPHVRFCAGGAQQWASLPLRRREFVTLLGGAATWPVAARAQQPERVRRIAVLQGGGDADDPRSRPNTAAFLQGLQQLGWTDGRNVRVDYRWPAGDADKARKYAAELVALAPDVILSVSSASLAPLLQATRTVPIVFLGMVDPVGTGFVQSLSRPGGNATGFMLFDYDLSAKWLELLKEIAPGVTRAAVLRDSAIPTGIGQFAVIQSVSRSVGVEVSPLNLRDAGEIEPALATFARPGNGGLIVTASPLSLVHRELTVTLAARHKLPAVYWERFFVAAGGLISYGPDQIVQWRHAAGYVDRILKGEKPADLPVQAPTKYELVINLKTAKALGLTVPPELLARADAVIE